MSLFSFARIFSMFLAVLSLIFTKPLPASADASDSSIAIIDTAWDTRRHLDELQRKGVLVIGRYYGRCPVEGLGQYRLIDQGLPSDPNSEISQIMARGMAILAIYQFRSKHRNKLRGRHIDGSVLPDAACNETSIPRSVVDEATLDANAALSQALDAGQPPNKGSAIYFGVDFDYLPSDFETQKLLVEYFQTLKPIVEAAGYKVGAYGSGRTLQILRDAPDGFGETGLIDFSWLMASPAYLGSSEFHRLGNWNLFQNEVDEQWFGKPGSGERYACNGGKVLDVDTNVQNPGLGEDVGFWRLDSSFAVPLKRSRAIFESRRFVCDGNAILRASHLSSSEDYSTATRCHRNGEVGFDNAIPFITSVWLTGRQHGNLVEVDVNEDGQPDGWTWNQNLTIDFSMKPDYIDLSETNEAIICSSR